MTTSPTTRIAATIVLFTLLSACAPIPAAPVESTLPATDAPVPAAGQTQRAAETPPELLGTPSGYPTEVIEAVVTDPLVIGLLAGLTERGLGPELLDASRVELLKEAPGQGYRLGNGWLHLHLYPDAQSAAAAAAELPLAFANTLIDWVAPPNLFQCDRLIVLYFGTDPSAIGALSELCAPPFYTTELPATPAPALLTDYSAVDAVADLPHTPLDPAITPTALHGREYVGLGADGEVYLVDWTTGEQSQITNDGLEKYEAVLSDDYIAWLAPSTQIVVFDRHTGEQRLVTTTPAPRMQLVLDGQRLAWADRRNELDAHYTASDIYAYDLSTNTEIAVAVAPGAQIEPSLSGDRLVWADNRDSAHLADNLAGCGNCPENRFDLYLYNFASQSTNALVAGPGLRSSPSLDGSLLAWVGYDASAETTANGMALGGGDVYMFDLETSQTRQITQTPDAESAVALSGQRLLWAISFACDVVTLQADGTPLVLPAGVYLLDLPTNAVQRLTSYVEPRALFDDAAALIVEGCMTGHSAYVAALE